MDNVLTEEQLAEALDIAKDIGGNYAAEASHEAADRIILSHRELAAEVAQLREDRDRLNWIQSEITDTIYLDDGRIVDVAGGNVRAAIDAARKENNAD